jgi:hypothetical protein
VTKTKSATTKREALIPVAGPKPTKPTPAAPPLPRAADLATAEKLQRYLTLPDRVAFAAPDDGPVRRSTR